MGEKAKLLLNSGQMPLIPVTKTNGGKIYFSAKGASGEPLMTRLRNA
jgi:hypothetical protein